MWSKIKRRHVKNDTFVWTNELAAKEAHCSKSNVKAIMRKLEKLGAITCIQEGRSGSSSRRANLYRREV
jgi:predicted transcriptional regulator